VQHDNDVNFSKIDLRALSATEWSELRAQIIRRARADRSKAIGDAIGTGLAWVWRWFWRFLKWSALRPAWISHVRRHREQVAAAQLRGLSDQWLADMGLTRGEIESRVRFHARRSWRQSR
jgi:hypothetical protein